MTLVEFLRARLDEDEQLARAAVIQAHDGPGAYQPHPELAAWHYVPGGEVAYVPTPEMLGHDYPATYLVTQDSEGILPAVDEKVGPHIARHDPAHVLAEVAAKRRIVKSYQWYIDNAGRPYAHQPVGEMVLVESYVRILAAVYTDHPDYDEAWRPS